MRKLIYSLLIVWCLLPLSVFAQEKEQEEILYIVSYNADTKYSLDFISEFTNEYEALGGQYNVVIEAMNCSSLDTSGDWMERMTNILEQHPYAKMVMLYGPEAWAAYFSLEDEKYKRIPVCSLAAQHYGAVLPNNDLPACSAERNPGKIVVDFFDFMKDFNVKMCYYYEYGVQEGFDLISKLLPETKHLTVISDNSYAGLSQIRLIQYLAATKDYPYDINYIDGTEVEMELAIKRLGILLDHSAIMYCSWRYDSKGTIYLTNNDPLFKHYTEDIPVMSLTGSGFGNWAIGGYHPNYNWNDGRQKPSELIYRILDLHEDIEPYFYLTPNRYRFDQQALTHFNIDKAWLPEKSYIINIPKKLTFAEIYRDYKSVIITICISLVIILIGVIFIISYDIHLRRAKRMLEQSEQALQQEKVELENYQHELLVAKERVEKSDQMKTHFIQNMSHEIRTPLNAIQGFSQLLLDPSLNLDEEHKQAMMMDIEQNIHSLTDRVTDILLLSNLDTDTSPVNYEPIHVNWLCNVVIDMMSAKKTTGVEIVLQSNLSDDVLVMSEQTYIYECLKQLLSNAIKFTQEGQIVVGCEHNSTTNQILISVTDNGPGIPEAEMENIFERFKKLDEFVPGTGLGLSICRAIAQRLHAEVYIDRTYTGKGTRFVFAIPA